MRVPVSWLREWVDPGLDTTALAERLTLLGLEVDSVEVAAPPFSGVVVGRIEAVEAHPQAEHLRVCQVADGSGRLQRVVCGAANATAGLHAPFARVGAVLPDGTEVRAARLRGVESHGMLCSAAELGTAGESAGLWELGSDAQPGVDLRAYAGLDDTILELDLTPNRGDCLSLRGVARELAAGTGASLSETSPPAVAATADDRFPVHLSAPAACPRYAGRVVRNVDAGAPTPAWLTQRLERAGVRPISALVDIANYVMLELGQPMHAFDLARLQGGIEVRWGQTGETLRLLDEREVALDADTLVIADGSGPVALAGIMGGAASAVSTATTDVFLESACFLPGAMAGRARRYSAHSDAAHRFERGVDPEMAPVALERATALITAICGGDAGPADDHVAAQHLPTTAHVTLRGERLRRLLGYAPPDSEVETLLQRLGLDVEADAAGWRTSVPSWRYDLLREEDLVEEVARVHGYNRAPRTHPAHTARIAPRSEQRRDAEALADSLVERGYHETVSYSFVDATLEAEINPAAEPLALANPIASDLGVMRTSLWPGLLRTATHNLNRQQERARLFERGVRFFAGDDGGLEQSEGLGLLAMGPRWPEQWSGDRTPVDFFDVKGDLEGLLAPLDSGRYRFVAAHHPALHPGQSARIEHAGTPIGWIGTLHPRLQQRLAFPRAPVLAEVALAPLLEQPLPQFESVSKFPAIRRDLAVIVDEEAPASTLVESARAAAPAELREVFVFDVYRGQGVDSGRKSIALGLILQGLSRTLTDSEVDRASHDVLNGLRASHGATLRE